MQSGATPTTKILGAPATAAAGGSGGGGHGHASGTGMLRDWKFSIDFSHRNARTKVSYLPRWEGLFIDVDDVEGKFLAAAQGSDMHKMSFAPLRKFLSFRDVTPALRVGEHYQEVPKDVTFFYCHIPPGATPKEFVKHCVRHALKDPHCVEVDGDTNTKHLRLGKKMQTGSHKLGGKSTTTFQYSSTVTYKTTWSSEYYQVFGGIVGGMGYCVSAMCTQKDELDAYFADSIIPHLTDPTKISFDIDVEYAETPTHFGLQKQQELFGELKWMDTDAALHFTMPMHPLILKPDYSPIQSVGAGTNACLSIDLSVYQKLADELSEREVTGMPKYKANQVLLFLEVEDAAAMGYGSNLSIEEYCLQKAKRVKETFPDLREVGSHVNQDIGPRTGRSTTCTFTYDVAGTKLSGSNVKCMMASTLVGNNGVTCLYFTKVGQGLFDAHLYLYQQLLRSVTFYHERQLTAKFSRHHSATVIRLKDQDLDKVYPKIQREMIELHAKSLHAASDGFIEGATLICVGDPTKEPVTMSSQVTTAAAPVTMIGDTTNGISEEGEGGGIINHNNNNNTHHGKNVGDTQTTTSTQGGGGHTGSAVYEEDDGEYEEEPEEEEDAETEEERALREAEERSIISVTEIKHLTAVEAWEDEDGDESLGQESPSRVLNAGADGIVSPISQKDSTERDTPSRSQGDTPAAGDAGAELGTGSKRDSMLSGVGANRGSITSPFARPSTGEGSRPGTGGSRRGTTGDGRMSTTGALDDSFTHNRFSPTGAADKEEDRSVDGGDDVGGDETTSRKKDEVVKDMTDAEIDALTREVEDTTSGPNLNQCYVECCEQQQCRPNSYLLKKLPTHPRFVASIEELDMASNYLGHSGFVAILHFLTYLKKVHTVHFNDMSLDNSDVDSLCTILLHNSTVTTVHLKNNPKISLPSVRRFSQLIAGNRRIKCLTLSGAAMSDALIGRLEGEAAKNEHASAELIADGEEEAERVAGEQRQQHVPGTGMFAPARRSQDSPVGARPGTGGGPPHAGPLPPASPLSELEQQRVKSQTISKRKGSPFRR